MVTFGVNYDGVFTREAQSFMHRLAKIKYPAVEGCQNYLVTRSNWIDHWVKAIQSGLVNTLAKGMAQSYTDLAAQHAVARAEPLRSLTPPPVPQGIPRFTFRGIAHLTDDAFPSYLQPEVTFIEGLDQGETVEQANGDGFLATSPVNSRSQRSRALAEHQRRDLLATPLRGPLTRLSPEIFVKETEEYDSVQESSVRQPDTRSVELVRLNEESENDDSRPSDEASLDQTSQSLVPYSQNPDPALSLAESSQSIIPHSEVPEHKRGDEVEVHTLTRHNGRIYTSVGIVRCADPARPQYVRLYGRKNYRKVLKNFTRHWTSMFPTDTQSSSEDSISQSY